MRQARLQRLVSSKAPAAGTLAAAAWCRSSSRARSALASGVSIEQLFGGKLGEEGGGVAGGVFGGDGEGSDEAGHELLDLAPGREPFPEEAPGVVEHDQATEVHDAFADRDQHVAARDGAQHELVPRFHPHCYLLLRPATGRPTTWREGAEGARSPTRWGVPRRSRRRAR